MEGGPYQEYFCIEIPVGSSSPSTAASADVSSSDGAEAVESATATTGATTVAVNQNLINVSGERGRHRRFVYVQEESAKKFPMQFGLEVQYTQHILKHMYIICTTAQSLFP